MLNYEISIKFGINKFCRSVHLLKKTDPVAIVIPVSKTTLLRSAESWNHWFRGKSFIIESLELRSLGKRNLQRFIFQIFNCFLIYQFWKIWLSRRPWEMKQEEMKQKAWTLGTSKDWLDIPPSHLKWAKAAGSFGACYDSVNHRYDEPLLLWIKLHLEVEKLIFDETRDGLDWFPIWFEIMNHWNALQIGGKWAKKWMLW